MSHKDVLFVMLDDAVSREKEKFAILGQAIDYLEETGIENEIKYVLEWLYKKKKFPQASRIGKSRMLHFQLHKIEKDKSNHQEHSLPLFILQEGNILWGKGWEEMLREVYRRIREITDIFKV